MVVVEIDDKEAVWNDHVTIDVDRKRYYLVLIRETVKDGALPPDSRLFVRDSPSGKGWHIVISTMGKFGNKIELRTLLADDPQRLSMDVIRINSDFAYISDHAAGVLFESKKVGGEPTMEAGPWKEIIIKDIKDDDILSR